MIIFTVLGFLVDGDRYVNFNSSVHADTPMDAIEEARRQNKNLVVSCVIRTGKVRSR